MTLEEKRKKTFMECPVFTLERRDNDSWETIEIYFDLDEVLETVKIQEYRYSEQKRGKTWRIRSIPAWGILRSLVRLTGKIEEFIEINEETVKADEKRYS